MFAQFLTNQVTAVLFWTNARTSYITWITLQYSQPISARFRKTLTAINLKRERRRRRWFYKRHGRTNKTLYFCPVLLVIQSFPKMCECCDIWSWRHIYQWHFAGLGVTSARANFHIYTTQHNTTHSHTSGREDFTYTHTHTCVESMLCSRGRSSSVSESAEDARIGVASASHLYLIFLLIILLLAPTLHEEITNRRCDQIL